MKKLRETATAFTISAIIIVLIIFSKSAKQGAIEGINLCESIIIPSLLSILILTNIIIKSNCRRVFEAIFGTVFEKVFRLPKCASAAVIFGLIGGYPAGAVLTSHLYRTNCINNKTASRIMRFNFCGGAAFIISAVGTVIYKNEKIGLILFLSNIISSLIIALGSSFFAEKPKNISSESPKLSLSEAICNSVEATVKSLAVMSAYIILFSALTSIIDIPDCLKTIIEITNGVCKSDVLTPLPYCAFFLSFGGLCIHFQLIGFLNEMKIKYFDFLVFRVLASLISFSLVKIYLYFSPETADVFSSITSSVPFELSQHSGALSLVMIIGCAVVIFDIENRKLKLS